MIQTELFNGLKPARFVRNRSASGRKGAAARWAHNQNQNALKLKCAYCLGRLGFGLKAARKRLFLSHGTAARFWKSTDFGIVVNRNKTASKREWYGKAKKLPKKMSYEEKTRRIESRAICRAIDKVIKETELFYSTGKTYDQRRKERQNAYEFNKYHTDVQHMLRARLRRRLRKLIGESKTGRKSESFVGCSLSMLVAHIQSQFKDGMGWHNYGQWHIDHIKPCASFDLTVNDNVLACFHYTNLQPLWAIDNMRKGDSISC